MKFELVQHFRVESARSLPYLPSGHPCSRVHGHSFKVSLSIVGDLDARIGWVMDYNDIEKLVRPILNHIDHRLLNEVPGLENPTSEYIAAWLYQKIKAVLPGLRQVNVSETPDTECRYPVV